MGNIVAQKERNLSVIKANTNASASIPALRAQVALLIDEVQKLKDILLGKGEVKDD